jgi:site-specific DNA recombinase
MPRSTALPTIALLYTRVSSEEQGNEGLSLDAQLADCRRYATAREWFIGAEYQDVMTGKRDDRPHYQALLAEARRLRRDGQAVVVVTKWLHRFGRRVSERVRCWEELDKLGAPIHSVAEGGVVSKLVHDILAAVAEEESRQIGERISSTWRHVTSKGWAKIGRVPWGYRLRKATAAERRQGSPKAVLEVDPTTSPYVVEAFEKLAAGQSARSVARWAAQLPVDARGGRTISWPTMQRAFDRTIYVGRPVNGEVDVLARDMGRWPALVTDDVWQRAQEQLAGHERMPHQASGQYMLIGLIRCPACGSRMRSDCAPGRRPRYRCSGADQASNCKQTASVDKVDEDVLRQAGAMIERLANDPEVAGSMSASRRRRQESATPDTSIILRQLESDVARSRQRILRGTEMFVDGEIDRQSYDALYASEHKKIAAAEAELESQRTKPAAPVRKPLDIAKVLGGKTWSEVVQHSDAAALRPLLAALIECVVPVRVRYGVYRADVTWC